MKTLDDAWLYHRCPILPSLPSAERTDNKGDGHDPFGRPNISRVVRRYQEPSFTSEEWSVVSPGAAAGVVSGEECDEAGEQSGAGYRDHEQIPRSRQSQADMAGRRGGGVSPRARWQFGFGKTGRLVRPPSPPFVAWARGGVVAPMTMRRSTVGIVSDRPAAASATVVCGWRNLSNHGRFQAVGLEGIPVSGSDPSRGVIDPTEKKVQIKPTGEWRCYRSE